MPTFEPDVAALRQQPRAHRARDRRGRRGHHGRAGGEALAAALGAEPVVFPGDHGGFTTSEWSPGNDPAAFAARLREVLAAG
jgi:hypothetical protein